MAYPAVGSKFFWSTNGTTYSTAAGGAIGEVTDFTGPGGAAAVIDVTHLLSTAKAKMMGLRDEGQLSLTLNHNATDAGQVVLITDRAARTEKKWGIKMYPGDGSTRLVTGNGYCLQYSVSGAVDNKITANVVIEISGAVTYTTG